MKKLFSIGFLIIFLFNVGGYYFVFLGLKHQAKTELIKQFDNECYSEANTIEFKIPITLPYEINQDEFERVDGDFTWQGKVYRLIKQKYSDGVLHVVCMLSVKEKLLHGMMSDFAKLSNDIPATSKSALSLLAKLVKDCETPCDAAVTTSSGWYLKMTTSCEISSETIARNIPVNSPPPEFS